MPRKPPLTPNVYSRDGKDYARIRVGPGKYRDRTLGPSGSAEARAAYARLLAEQEALGAASLARTLAPLTMGQLVRDYTAHVRAHYQRPQLYRVKSALAPVLTLYLATPAVDFGPNALRAVRQAHVAAGHCRRHVGQLVGVVRRMFRWAVANELLEVETLLALQQLEPLRKKDVPRADPPPVRPVEDELVEATLPHLPPVVADMVRLQRLTGMRPGEVCALRPGDLLRPWKTIDGQEVWLYRLDGKHKNDWKGQARWVPIVPAAQRLLAPYLARPPEAYCFSPAESFEAFQRKRREARVASGKKSAAGQRKASARWRPKDYYTIVAFDQAVAAACKRARLPHWSPNQVRHAVGTEVETLLGREDARCALGHANPTMTARYAEGVERAARALLHIRPERITPGRG